MLSSQVEFFQNDIYLPTRNMETPTMSAADYASGKDKPLEVVDLRPEGMKLRGSSLLAFSSSLH